MSNLNDEISFFAQMLDDNKYDFVKLAFLIFPYGEKGHPLEKQLPYQWQMEEWAKMSKHFSNPLTRDLTYKIAISTGNGSGKTAWAAQTNIMLLYTQKLRGRLTGNTKPQLTQVVWPEYDKWLKYARYSDVFFERLGESIKTHDEKLHDQWRLDIFTWDAQNPAAVSGLHNQGFATSYTFEEAPGIPANIFQYANGAFTDIDTIKIWIVLGNSDDPDSKFEQLMEDPGWNSRRIDTRSLPHVSRDFIQTILRECGGDEDADDFRVRVRGLPRKTNADSIINRDRTREALERRHDFDIATVNRFPCILTCDPAWTGGDMTTIWMHQGHYSKLLAAYKLDKNQNEDHKITYDLLVNYERILRADAVWIDQGEGTAIKTLANNDQRYHWDLVNFGGSPTDTPKTKDSDYANMRAQLYYESAKYLNEGAAVIDFSKDIILEDGKDVAEMIIKQFGWTKGDRHKVTNKKICESKKELKIRVGESPDLTDGFVIRNYRKLFDRLPENEIPETNHYTSAGRYVNPNQAGSRAIDMPESVPNYDMRAYRDVYRQATRFEGS